MDSQFIDGLELRINQVNRLLGSNYILRPNNITAKKTIINIQNDDVNFSNMQFCQNMKTY